MKISTLLRYCLVANWVWFSLAWSVAIFAANVDDSLNVIDKTNRSSSQSQQRIDKIALETQRMLEEYQSIVRNTEYQDAYNAQLQQLQQDQSQQIASLKEQQNDINVTQMRIMPLILSMADALEKFIVLDLPFQQEQRINGIVQLKQHLRNPAISVTDKYRLVLEAYQIESDYGRTLAVYRDKLKQDQADISVEFLRVGRIALYFQTLDGQRSGIWSKQSGTWQDLPATMNGNIKQALQVAHNRVAPQLLNLPIADVSVLNKITESAMQVSNDNIGGDYVAN